MQLKDYVNVIRQRWLVIFATAFVAALAAYAFSKMQPSIFRAETSYLVDQSRNDYGLNLAVANVMNSYRELLLSRPRLEQASAELQLDMTADQLLQDVAVQPRPDERKIIIQVDHTDPGVAARIANKLGDIMQAEVARINETKEGFDKISVIRLNPAEAPQGRHSPNTRLNVAAAGMLGGILGLLLAFLLFFLDDTLKTSGDVERYVGLTTVGAIPTLDQSGAARARGAAPGRWLPRFRQT